MTTDKLFQFLLTSKLVSRINADAIVSHFELVRFEKNALCLEEGRVCDHYLFLENGFMRAFAFDPRGNEVTTNFYKPNEVVFEVSSFFKRIPSRENIQCLSDCACWSISYEKLNHLFHSIHDFREFGRFILVQGFSTLKLRMLSTITETAEVRYGQLLQQHPEIFRYAQLKHIASYLGITDSSLSRIRKDFANK